MPNDIDRRLDEHVSSNSVTTAKYLPLELVFVQVCKDGKEAWFLEKYLKSGAGREIINELYGEMGSIPSLGTDRN